MSSYLPTLPTSCPDTEIQVLPNLGIAVDRVSCPDTDIRVSGTICITYPILHKIVCIDLKCNGYVLVLIEVELFCMFKMY